MEEPFKKIVSQIFNNWTALRLAVDHSMGGPNSKQTAIDFMNYMVQYCLFEQNVEVEGIQDALEDILDEEFETVCEDDSPKQIAQLLYRFLTLLKEGNTTQCDLEFQNLPSANFDWLNQQIARIQSASNRDSSDSSDSETEGEIPMEQEAHVDDGWTEVKNRRKR